jgi:Flp pilus assembly protein TadG
MISLKLPIRIKEFGLRSERIMSAFTHPGAVAACRRRKATRGSATVEMSLIGAMFFILLFGIADFGQFLFVQQALVERARAAARWGAATDPTNTTAIQNVALYSQSTVPSGGTPFLGLTASMVSVATADAGTDNYRLVVQISGYSFHVLSPYLAPSYQGPPITVSVPLGLYD